jgi:hypothetical protein
MSVEPKIIQLAREISQKTGILGDYLAAHSLPFPSLDASGALSVQVPEDEIELQSARVTAIEACEELRALLMGPRELLALNVLLQDFETGAVTQIFTVDHEHKLKSDFTLQAIPIFPGRRRVFFPGHSRFLRSECLRCAAIGPARNSQPLSIRGAFTWRHKTFSSDQGSRRRPPPARCHPKCRGRVLAIEQQSTFSGCPSPCR